MMIFDDISVEDLCPDMSEATLDDNSESLSATMSQKLWIPESSEVTGSALTVAVSSKKLLVPPIQQQQWSLQVNSDVNL